MENTTPTNVGTTTHANTNSNFKPGSDAMALNQNVVSGKWLEIKGEIQKTWGKLTNDELEKTKGDMKAISGIIQQKYGEVQDSYTKKVADIFHRFESKVESKKDEVIAGVKHAIKN